MINGVIDAAVKAYKISEADKHAILDIVDAFFCQEGIESHQAQLGLGLGLGLRPRGIDSPQALVFVLI